jgi:acyl carrier protein
MVMLISFLEDNASLEFRPTDVVLDNLDTVERILSFAANQRVCIP